MSKSEIPEPAVQQLIDHDIDCIKCGYNLRGLAMSGTCPECGAPVVLSADPNRRAERHLRWLGRVQTGSILLLASEAVSLVYSLILVVFAIDRLIADLLYDKFVTESIVSCMALPSYPLWLIAIWFLTTSDPTNIDPKNQQKYSNARRWIYSLFAAGLTTNYLVFILGFRHSPSESGLIEFIWTAATALISLAASFAVVLHLRRIADRAASERVSRILRMLQYVLLIGKVVTVFAVVPRLLTSGDSTEVDHQLVYIGSLITDALYSSFMVFALVRFSAAIDKAKESLVMMDLAPPRA